MSGFSQTPARTRRRCLASARHPLQRVVHACGLELTIGIANRDDSYDVFERTSSPSPRRCARSACGSEWRTAKPSTSLSIPRSSARLVWTLETADGNTFDLHFEPAGTSGYADLAQDALRLDLGDGLAVAVASLRDLIRMKQAAGRPKDLAQIPALVATLEQQRGGSDR
ncbi:MAG TPA: hypothetical protein VFM41_00125 [Gaiella sp.]|nr:hypothetical protein [Gaiella sp.]